MDRNTSPVEIYEAPEVLDLGAAEELTLCDGTGCACDGCGCKRCCGSADLSLE